MHSFLHGQVGMELIILHNVTRQFPELAQISFVSVNGDRTFDSRASLKKQKQRGTRQ